ncbi:MAG: 2-oxoglutarate and iron-dependent oxygenase domain-containing protein [Hyphomonas sp.]|uniref:2-oxoglutarate and iron-dependent oxygenase domain-containing protein n=1 Tax=Hyphomonas sp. TaxID=87 RepID=UPI0034A005D9
MKQTPKGTDHGGETLNEIPIVDWLDLEHDREKLLRDIEYALSECGFMVLANAPGLDDDFQQRAFKEVRAFFDSSPDVKQSVEISQSPYFRGYSDRKLKDIGHGQIIETFQYSFEQPPVSAHDDESFPLHDRLMKGPNIWPEPDELPGFRPIIEKLCDTYHSLTHMLGELIVESLGEDSAEFRRYFDFDDPNLAASLNHNHSLSAFPEESRARVRADYAKFDSSNVGTHIDGPPFVALLINDRPGLQVVAGEGRWINAPVTCRTADGDYPVPVIPGSVIVNTGGTLMHLSEGRYSATLHRANTTLIPEGETRVSMPYFLLPKTEGDLVPFGKSSATRGNASGYDVGRDRGANACVNRMGTFPQVTRRWWQKEFDALREKAKSEVESETNAAFEFAAKRGERYKNRTT